MGMRVKALLFDMGGTLVHSKEEFRLRKESLARILRGLKYGVDNDLEKALRCWDSFPEDVEYIEHWDMARVALLLAKLGIKPKPLLVEEIYKAVVQSSVEGWYFEDGCKETLLTLKERGYFLGVISNTGSREQIMRLLIKGDLLELMDVVVTSQELGIKKPHPLIFKYAQLLLGLKSSEIAYVGNDPKADVEGAKNVGWVAVQKINEDVAPSPLADITIKKIKELLGYF